MSQSRRVFLSAEWRDLVMLNYEVEPGLLSRYVPPGTVLDSFQGRTYLSLVGFRFCHTKLLGCFPVPFHSNFDEVNLRFYVRRKERCDEDRRGVVFIAEVVPMRAIAATARIVYGENYKHFPMRHRIETEGVSRTAEYQWQLGEQWCGLSAQTVVRQHILKWGLWNSSSPNTTGVTRLDEAAVPSNITFRMPHGKCGRPLTLDLKETPALFMGMISPTFCSDALIARSWRMARPSSSSGAIEFDENARP
jgi:Uncharacterized conserved protein (COG2071)